MARLDDLSTELILDILGRIPPEDLQSTTLISKTVYPIASTLLDRHRQVLVQQYEEWNDIVTIDATHQLYHHTHMHAGLLCTILSDRRLAKMVKTLRFHDLSQPSEANCEMEPEETWRPDQLFPGFLPGLRKSQRLAEGNLRTRAQILEEAVCQCALVSRIQRKTWLKELQPGNEELAAILLLWHLPTLRSITLHLKATEWTVIHAFLLQIVEHAVSASARPTAAHIPAGLPLQHLSYVYLTFHKSRSEDVALIRAFLSLPRLSHFTCRELSVSSVRKATPLRRLAERSAIDSLIFNNCIMDIGGLLRLLEGVPAVTHFTHTWYQRDSLDTYDWVKFGPSAVVAALIGSIGFRLETLELRVWPGFEMQYIDGTVHFRDFRALKWLTVATNILLAEDGSNLSSFVFMLPEKIEGLTLFWIERAPIPDICTFSKFLKTFIDQVKDHLTSLYRLTIIGELDVGELEESLAEKAEIRYLSSGHLELSIIGN